MGRVEKLKNILPGENLQQLQELYCSTLPAEKEFSNHIRHIDKLPEVLSSPPMSEIDSDKKEELTIFCDFDGVVIDNFPVKNDNYANFLALRTMCRKAERLVIWSTRAQIKDKSILGLITGRDKGISCAPLITNSSKDRLRGFLEKADSGTQRELDLSMGKIFGDGNFSALADEALEEADQKLVVIGSSHFDRKRVRGFLENCDEPEKLKRFWYFDTGHWFY